MKKVGIFAAVFAVILVFLVIKYLKPTISAFNNKQNTCAIYGENYTLVEDKTLNTKCCCPNSTSDTCNSNCQIVRN